MKIKTIIERTYIMTTKATNKSGMSDAAKKARAEYQRKWRKDHPDKAKEYANRHWERMAEKAKNETMHE